MKTRRAFADPAVAFTPASPDAFEHEDFRALVLELLRSTDLMADEVQVRLGYLYGDSGEPGWTWVEFVLNEAARESVRGVIAAVTVWGRTWLKKARESDPDAAPIKAVIYGPDGEVLAEVEVRPEEP